VDVTTNAVNRWKAVGALYLWKYLENERNYPGVIIRAGTSLLMPRQLAQFQYC
jgi:hypothetical protein